MSAPHLELSITDPEQFTAEVHAILHVEELADIDFESIQQIPLEINRRRAILSFFIPNVFTPGKYDRRADLIDGSLYYLESEKKTREAYTILQLWKDRLGLKDDYHQSDLEWSSYGPVFYHPIYSVLGHPQMITNIPRLIEYVQAHYAMGEVRAPIDLSIYSNLFNHVYNSDILHEPIHPRMLEALTLLFSAYQEFPLTEPVTTTKILSDYGFKSAKFWANKINKFVMNQRLYEKSPIGITNFRFLCSTHIRVDWKKGDAPVTQNFLTGAYNKGVIQEVVANIPIQSDFKKFYEKFPEGSRCFRLTFLRPSDKYIPQCWQYYDIDKQKFIVPWRDLVQQWKLFMTHLLETPDMTVVQPNYPHDLKISYKLLQILNWVRADATIKNTRIKMRGKFSSLEEVIEIRHKIEEAMFVQPIFFTRGLQLNATLVLTVPGAEKWKYQFLRHIQPYFPASSISIEQDVITGESYLMGEYAHTFQDAQAFKSFFIPVFSDMLDLELYVRHNVLQPIYHWFNLYDPESDTWKWDPDDFEIIPFRTHFK